MSCNQLLKGLCGPARVLSAYVTSEHRKDLSFEKYWSFRLGGSEDLSTFAVRGVFHSKASQVMSRNGLPPMPAHGIHVSAWLVSTCVA